MVVQFTAITFDRDEEYRPTEEYSKDARVHEDVGPYPLSVTLIMTKYVI